MATDRGPAGGMGRSGFSRAHEFGTGLKRTSAKLNRNGALDAFNVKLRREWAVETGVIENVNSIDVSITVLLIEKGIKANLIPHGTIDKPPAGIVAILEGQERALEGISEFVRDRRPLSNS